MKFDIFINSMKCQLTDAKCWQISNLNDQNILEVSLKMIENLIQNPKHFSRFSWVCEMLSLWITSNYLEHKKKVRKMRCKTEA